MFQELKRVVDMDEQEIVRQRGSQITVSRRNIFPSLEYWYGTSENCERQKKRHSYINIDVIDTVHAL